MAKELEQFLGRGNEKAFWIFTYKNAGGAILLAYFGTRLGQALGGGFFSFMCGLAGAIIGLVLTLDRKGFMWVRRWIFTLRFYITRATAEGKTLINAQELYEIVELKEQPIIIRRAGQVIMTPRSRE